MSFDRKFTITYGLAKRLRDEGAVDLLGANAPQSIAEALFDLDRVGRAVAVLLGDDADEVLDSLEPQDIAKAREALREAIVNFIRSTNPQTTAAVERLLEKRDSLQAKSTAAVVAHLESDELDTKLDAAIGELLSKTSASLPGSSA